MAKDGPTKMNLHQKLQDNLQEEEAKQQEEELDPVRVNLRLRADLKLATKLEVQVDQDMEGDRVLLQKEESRKPLKSR